MRSKWSNYNDGIMALSHDEPRHSTFGGYENVTEPAKPYNRVHFARASVRDQDVQFAEQIGISFSLKVKARNVPECRVGDKAAFGGMMYNVESIDRSNDRTEMFLYLELVREA